MHPNSVSASGCGSSSEQRAWVLAVALGLTVAFSAASLAPHLLLLAVVLAALLLALPLPVPSLPLPTPAPAPALGPAPPVPLPWVALERHVAELAAEEALVLAFLAALASERTYLHRSEAWAGQSCISLLSLLDFVDRARFVHVVRFCDSCP